MTVLSRPTTPPSQPLSNCGDHAKLTRGPKLLLSCCCSARLQRSVEPGERRERRVVRNGAEALVTQTEVERQVRSDLPLVVDEKGMRRDVGKIGALAKYLRRRACAYARERVDGYRTLESYRPPRTSTCREC